ncbi:hypothetical protein DFQ30_004640, partial [Apophysomyces sp. BC1015]
KEACPLNLAPTASTTATLALGDALAVAVLDARGFSADDFARSHPGGTLGRRLLTYVRDVMRTGDEVPRVTLSATVRDALLEITAKRLGMTAIVDPASRVEGIFTDGDLRRVLEHTGDILSLPITEVMTRKPRTIRAGQLAVEAVELMERFRINQMLSSDPTMALTATERAARVKLMIFDVDGVLTDGTLYFTCDGDAMKGFNSMDGHGLKLLEQAGISTAIITGRHSKIVERRARELHVPHLYQGISDKLVAFGKLLEAAGVAADECGYMGDDWPDLAVMLRVGFAAAPASAHPEVLGRAHWIANARGGHGAAREVIDTLLRAQHRYDGLLAAACGG